MRILLLPYKSIRTALVALIGLLGLTACVTCNPPYCHDTHGYLQLYNPKTAPLSGRPVSINGHAALKFAGPDEIYTTIERHSFEGNDSYSIPAYPLIFAHQHPKCLGYMYFTNNTIGYNTPSPTCIQPIDKSLLSNPDYTPTPNSVIPRTQLTGIGLLSGNGSPASNIRNSYLLCISASGKSACTVLVWKTASGALEADVIEDSSAAGVGSWLFLLKSNYAAADSQFMKMVSVLIPQSQRAEIKAAQAAGDNYYSKGDYANALTSYMQALKISPLIWTVMSDTSESLRTKIINSAVHMSQPPKIPNEAIRDETFGKVAVENAKGMGDMEKALVQFAYAVNTAPWWADGYYNLAVALEKMKDYGYAAKNLQYYLRANPHAPDASKIKIKIYALQYQAKQQNP